MPRAAATKASAMPVLPLVGSTISLSARAGRASRRPRSAPRRCGLADRVRRVAPLDLSPAPSAGAPSRMRCSLTSGVRPMDSEFLIDAAHLPPQGSRQPAESPAIGGAALLQLVDLGSKPSSTLAARWRGPRVRRDLGRQRDVCRFGTAAATRRRRRLGLQVAHEARVARQAGAGGPGCAGCRARGPTNLRSRRCASTSPATPVCISSQACWWRHATGINGKAHRLRLLRAWRSTGGLRQARRTMRGSRSVGGRRRCGDRRRSNLRPRRPACQRSFCALDMRPPRMSRVADSGCAGARPHVLRHAPAPVRAAPRPVAANRRCPPRLARHTASSAWSRSAFRSSTCSMPTDRRTASSDTPV